MYQAGNGYGVNGAPVAAVPAGVGFAAAPPPVAAVNAPGAVAIELRAQYTAAARRYTHVPAQDYFRASQAVPAQGLPRGYYEYMRPHVDEEQTPDWAERV